jgi:uncharacterized protein HemX
MINKPFLAVTAVLFSLILALTYLVYSGAEQAGKLKEANSVLMEAQNRAIQREQADRKVLVARQAKIAAQARKLAQANSALSEALESNKAWSDTDVPTDVQEALRGPIAGPADGL